MSLPTVSNYLPTSLVQNTDPHYLQDSFSGQPLITQPQNELERAILRLDQMISELNQKFSDQAQSGIGGAQQASSTSTPTRIGELLQGKQEVSEEELYSAVIQSQLEGVDKNLGTAYQEEFSKLANSLKGSDGYIPYEHIANESLKQVGNRYGISAETISGISNRAFTAAQLDGNKSVLYDHLGTTKAVANTASAVSSAESILSGISNGSIAATPRGAEAEKNTALGLAATQRSSNQVGTTNSGNTLGNGFLWKPSSDKDGKLAILLPPNLTTTVSKVEIEKNGSVVATGKYSGIGNGARTHFRFPKPGAGYGSNLTVAVTLTNGQQVRMAIPNGGTRVS